MRDEREGVGPTELGRDIHNKGAYDRDKQYTLTQRCSKQFNIELNKQVMRIRTQESSVTSF